MTTSRRIQPWRWAVMAAHAVLVLGLPFVTVNGRSALRFDLPSLTLFFFGGRIGMDEFFIVLVALLVLGFLVVLLTILLGRVWCGWLCPQTVVVELTRFVDRLPRRGTFGRAVVVGVMLPVSALLAAAILWYFVPPRAFLEGLAAGSLGPVVAWSWAVLTVVTFLNFLFLRRRFCTSVCPYAKLQGALFDDRTLVIAPAAGWQAECMGCDACVHACPVGIDVRAGLDAACVSCAECIDACVRQRERLDRPSLIGYRAGGGETGRPFRSGVVLAGSATVIFLVLLIALVANRPVIEISLAADAASPPRREGRELVNFYLLSLANRSEEELHLVVAGRIDGLPAAVAPDRMLLGPGERRRTVLRVAGTASPGPDGRNATVFVRSLRDPGVHAEARARFLPAW